MPGYTLPKKPEGGWPLLVTPLLGDGKRGEPFVALPDASRRELNEDEKLYLDYFKKEVRAARMVPVGHAWEVSGNWREFLCLAGHLHGKGVHRKGSVESSLHTVQNDWSVLYIMESNRIWPSPYHSQFVRAPAQTVVCRLMCGAGSTQHSTCHDFFCKDVF
jgi:hypothetical protein